jgi:16S rRNA (guanine966-N2)-methyltransferase
LQALRENLEALELLAPRAQVRARDALTGLRAARKRGETYDLVFLDPPYGQARALEGPLSATLPAMLKPAARVVVESDRRSPLVLEPLEPLTEKRYGDTLITIYSHQFLSDTEQEPQA